jgi:hypothetical protein
MAQRVLFSMDCIMSSIGVILQNADFIDSGAKSKDDNLILVKKLFAMMFGNYGTKFLSTYRTGVLDIDGKDKGMQSAIIIWANALKAYSGQTIEAAFAIAKERHLEWPPTLGQFESYCKASEPRKVWQAPSQLAIAEGEALRKERSRLAREAAFKRFGKANKQQGLEPLAAAIADGVRCAGGDEVFALRRVENLLNSGRN